MPRTQVKAIRGFPAIRGVASGCLHAADRFCADGYGARNGKEKNLGLAADAPELIRLRREECTTCHYRQVCERNHGMRKDDDAAMGNIIENIKFKEKMIAGNSPSISYGAKTDEQCVPSAIAAVSS